ncbi:MAG: hypothetical protein JST30_08625 [Armatimonadetes bacterium]|nr:hypothetical protein [Armatimonadota bacterium]
MRKTHSLLIVGTVLASSLAAVRAINPGTTTGTWSGVGKLGFFTPTTYTVSGVAIGEHWVLSSSHGTSSDHPKYQLDGGSTYNGVWLYRHRWADLSLIELDGEQPGVTDYHDIYEGSDELGQLCFLQGYGIRGQYNTNSCRWEDLGGTYGVNRDGTNTISYVQRSSIGGDFDGYTCAGKLIDTLNDGGPTYDECGVAVGDSGGPTFIYDTDGSPKVAGIHSSGGGGTGSFFGDARVSKSKLWIAGVKSGTFAKGDFPIYYFEPWYGNVIDGWVDETTVSDEQRLVIKHDPPAYGTGVQFVVNTYVETWAAFTCKLEAQVPEVASGSDVKQKIEIYNWSTSAWEQKDLRTATSTDSTVTVSISTNVANYLSSGTAKFRFTWYEEDSASEQLWHAKIDRIVCR